mgnify:CR=1 FL=1
MTVASVTIDAGVLAVPYQAGTEEDVHRYVETLLDWSNLLKERWLAIYMSDRASEALLDDGLYPLRDHLSQLFTAQGIVEYNVNDVATIVDRLLQLTPSFQTYFSILDVLTEGLSTEPDILRFCSGKKLQSDLARCIVLIAILRQHCQNLICDHSMILRYAPGKTVRVRSLIHVLEHERADLRTLPVPPEHFEGDVLVCDDFLGLIDCLDETSILRKATDEIGIETAIRITVYKSRLALGTVPEWDNVPEYRVGHAFRLSLQRIELTKQLVRKLLRAIVETLEQTNMASTHWLRTGLGGNDPQRVRANDQAKAWRRDIDRDYHLHYWYCEDGIVEIASVSFPHDDFSIPE